MFEPKVRTPMTVEQQARLLVAGADPARLGLFLQLARDPVAVRFEDRLHAWAHWRLVIVPPWGWAVGDGKWELTPLGRAVFAAAGQVAPC